MVILFRFMNMYLFFFSVNWMNGINRILYVFNNWESDMFVYRDINNIWIFVNVCYF